MVIVDLGISHVNESRHILIESRHTLIESCGIAVLVDEWSGLGSVLLRHYPVSLFVPLSRSFPFPPSSFQLTNSLPVQSFVTQSFQRCRLARYATAAYTQQHHSATAARRRARCRNGAANPHATRVAAHENVVLLHCVNALHTAALHYTLRRCTTHCTHYTLHTL